MPMARWFVCKDVGHAELGAEDYSTDLDYNGHEAVGIAVTQLSTANALDVHRKLRRRTRSPGQALSARHEV